MTTAFHVLALGITIIAINTIREKFKLLFWKMTFKIPDAGSWPLFSEYPKDFLSYLSTIHQKYGSVVRHWFGSNIVIFLNDPQDVEQLLKDSTYNRKSFNYDFLKPWLGEGLLTSSGDHWGIHRKLIAPAFHFKIFEECVVVFNNKAKILIDAFRGNTKKENFDIAPYVNLYALDTIVETAMGIPCNTLEKHNLEYVDAIRTVTRIAQKRAGNCLLRCNTIFALTPSGAEYRKALKIINDFSYKVIKTKKQELGTETKGSPKTKEAFLNLLLKEQSINPELSDKDIFDEVNTFIFAGRDTTASAVAFTLYHLSRNPEVQQNTFEEVVNLFGKENKDVTLEDLEKASYLDKVIQESLRLSPPIPVFSRNLEFDLKLSKYTLPTKSNVSVSAYLMHRNPEIYPNPQKFDPERFNAENKDSRSPFAYLPFSAGSRNCIGKKYAQLEMKTVLINLLRKFKFYPGEDIQETVNTVLTSSNGIKLKLEERN